MPGKKYLIVLAGPTGVGKTDVAMQMAKHFQAEIISADARQFYRELNIGTAKPTSSQLIEVTHHFINSFSIHDAYDVRKFETDVISLLGELHEKQNIVILCGGSGLFIQAVLNGMDELPASDPEIRKMLDEKLRKDGIGALQDLLQDKDPEYFMNIDRQNPHRIIRALEVCMITGQKYSELRRNVSAKRNFVPINIYLNLDRETLYERINRRVDVMMQQGLLEEAKRFYPYKKLPALNTLGYKELFAYEEGKMDLQSAVESIKQNTRNYAKRQGTWFKKYFQGKEFSPADIELILKHVEEEMR